MFKTTALCIFKEHQPQKHYRNDNRRRYHQHHQRHHQHYQKQQQQQQTEKVLTSLRVGKRNWERKKKRKFNVTFFLF